MSLMILQQFYNFFLLFFFLLLLGVLFDIFLSPLILLQPGTGCHFPNFLLWAPSSIPLFLNLSVSPVVVFLSDQSQLIALVSRVFHQDCIPHMHVQTHTHKHRWSFLPPGGWEIKEGIRELQIKRKCVIFKIVWRNRDSLLFQLYIIGTSTVCL